LPALNQVPEPIRSDSELAKGGKVRIK